MAPNIIRCVWSLSYLSKYSLISLKNDAECGLAFHYSTSICNCITPLLDNRALRVWPVSWANIKCLRGILININKRGYRNLVGETVSPPQTCGQSIYISSSLRCSDCQRLKRRSLPLINVSLLLLSVTFIIQLLLS